jgi:hypothetical protein
MIDLLNKYDESSSSIQSKYSGLTADELRALIEERDRQIQE